MDTYNAQEAKEARSEEPKDLDDFITNNALIKVCNIYELDEVNLDQYEEHIWYSQKTNEFFRYGEASHAMETFGDYWREENVQRGDLVWAASVAHDIGYDRERFTTRLKELIKTGIIS